MGEYNLPAGGGDDSISGKGRGKEHLLAIKIPADSLELGLNEIVIDNTKGNAGITAAGRTDTGWLVGNGVDGAKASDRAWPQVV